MNNTLQDDIHFLSQLLDQVTAEQFGPEILRLIEELRQISRERRTGLPGAEERLVARIAAMSGEEIRRVIPALIIFFDLANMAEDTQRIRVLRDRERASGDAPRGESIRDAILTLKAQGTSPDDLERIVDRLRVELVFTAHPTEAKRRTTRQLIRSLRERLHTIHTNRLLESERRQLREDMHADLTILSQINLFRPERPTVMQEVERGLFFIEELWQVAPRISGELREAASEALHQPYEPPRAFLRFGSWIGGDRDGNPFVTTDVTNRTLRTLREAAIRRHQTKTHELSRVLVMSDDGVAIPDSVRQATESAAQRWPALAQVLEPIVASERYRRWLRVIEWRLEQTRPGDRHEAAGGAYSSTSVLLADVDLLAKAIRSHHGDAIVQSRIEEWRDQVRTFGLHFSALDVRQDSRVHVDVLAELFRDMAWNDRFADLDEEGRGKLLHEALTNLDRSPYGQDETALSDITRDTLSLFQLVAETFRDFGPDPIGGAVISMTHQVSDILAVLWLWRSAWRRFGRPERNNGTSHLPVVPLFETIEDLENSAEILEAMLSDPIYRAYLEEQEGEPTQVVMVGYSDSTKDGGYLAASWGLYRAQERLAEVADRQGVRMIVFHGRGGALGRGGGPAARAILSLPPRAVDGAVRVTEQGEVLPERYDDPQIAHRHLEQVSWATLLVDHIGEVAPAPEWVSAMESLCASSLALYRRLVEHPGFLTYFDRATPIGEIERLPIGSRPARRRTRRTLDDLRAIPWTFAWTQCRHMIPAWYGVGTAFETFAQAAGGDWSRLQEMYDEWALFRAVVDNADLALAKSDMSIAHRYAELAEGEQPAQVWSLIQEEYARSRAAILLVTGEQELLGGIAWLQRSIQERNPYVDPLNLIQIELTRRLRSHVDENGEGIDEEAEQIRRLIRLSIQGVAAGLRTTG